ncbi:permease prefix domain 1-containing protein [Microbacterium elymi]|uniref:Permease prefix domain 1-containing protein n=1 Tax=Microbacterium elymi TaxID=2909587 RepID=A0ABY5NHZ6_9MICO|nr:permease prefix domain 1-containing protein [Microbacterium elymi]UUT34819.1 permease prefix domain 1-containing protein [Microbacterium elymi]
MDAATLTERYVDAAMRTVPQAQRSDLSAELHASIADQIDARIEAGDAPASAEAAVLTELGDPEVLAAGYTGRPAAPDRTALLPRLVAPDEGAAVDRSGVHGVRRGTGTGARGGTRRRHHRHHGRGRAHVDPARGVLDDAHLRHPRAHRPRDDGCRTLDAGEVAEPKQSGATFADMVASIVMLLALAGAMLWDLRLGFVPGHRVSLLDAELWPIAILILFAIMACKAVLVIMVHLHGRWTARDAVVNAVLVLAAVGTLVYNNGHLLNPGFFEAVGGADGAAGAHRVVTIVAWFVIGVIALWDILDTFLKARRSRR